MLHVEIRTEQVKKNYENFLNYHQEHECREEYFFVQKFVEGAI
jgi:hypothetical protein